MAGTIVHGYTSLDKVKTRQGTRGTTDDVMIEAIITSSSRMIDDYCGQHFYSSAETRVYSPTSLFYLLVDELLSVTSLKTDEDADRVYETVWATTDYDLLPTNAPYATPPGPYWEIRVRPNGAFRFPYWWPLTVQIIGGFGAAASTPPVVEEACLAQVATLMQSSDVPLGMREGGPLPTRPSGAGLHPFVRQMLDPYKRVHAG